MPQKDLRLPGRTWMNSEEHLCPNRPKQGHWTGPRPRAHDAAMTGQRDYFTLAEVAEMLGVHPVTIRRRIAAGLIPGYKVGNQVRVRRTDVDLLLRRIPVG